MDATLTKHFSVPIAVCAAIMAVTAFASSDLALVTVIAVVACVTVIVEAAVIRGLARELEWRR